MLEPNEDLIYSDPEGYKQVQEEQIIWQSRWNVGKRRVVQCQTTGRFYAIYWQEGATENQHEDREVNVKEVWPYSTVDYEERP